MKIYMVCPITQGDHKKVTVKVMVFVRFQVRVRMLIAGSTQNSSNFLHVSLTEDKLHGVVLASVVIQSRYECYTVIMR